MLSTPSGSRSAASSASRRVVSGVCSEGFRTSVLPVSNAGQIFHTPISSGKFHGATEPTTPSGSRRMMLV